MTRRKDASIPVVPFRGPLTPGPARLPERSVTVEAVHQHTGPGVAVSTAEANGSGTLTIQVWDPAKMVNPANPVEFYATVLGIRTLVAATTKPSSGTDGTYTYTFPLDPKHATLIEPVIHMADGTDVMPGSETFDSDKRSNVVNATVAEADTEATVYVNFDTDTAIGTGKGQYSLDGGGTWTPFDVAANETGSFTITMLSTGTQTVNIRGLDADGTPGPSVVVQISQFASTTNTAATGPSLSVTPTPGPTSYSVGYSGTGTITYSLDGAAFVAAPASPVVVNRSAPNGADHTIVFKAELNGQTITDGCVIPAIGATDTDTVTPDLTIVPGVATATTIPFTATASNPKAGGATPTITATIHGTSMHYNGSTYTDGQSVAVANAGVVTVDRPAFTSPVASVTFEADLGGGGAEIIQRTIPNQDKTSFGPNLTVTASSSGTQCVITWSGDSVQYSKNSAAFADPPASPWTVTRPAAGQPPDVYTFHGVKDGQTVVDSVIVPGVNADADTVTPDLTVTPGVADATTQPFTVSASNPKGGTAPTISITLHGCSMVYNSTTYTDGETVGVPSGSTVVVNRQPFNSPVAAVVFVAALAGGGAEMIQRTIPNQDKVSFGPTLHALTTPASDHYDIVVTYDGNLEESVDGAAYQFTIGGSPHSDTVTRAVAGDHTRSYRCTKDGQTISETITIPALGGTSGGNAPIDAEYITASANGSLTAERVLTDTSEVTWDKGTAGQVKAVIAAALARLGVAQTWTAIQTFTANVLLSASLRFGTIGSIGGMELYSPGTSPVSRRTSFGTDGSGWEYRIAKNVAGTETDLLGLDDAGKLTVGRNNPAPANSGQLRIQGGSNTGLVSRSSGWAAIFEHDTADRQFRVDNTTSVLNFYHGASASLAVFLSANGSAVTFPGAVHAQGNVQVDGALTDGTYPFARVVISSAAPSGTLPNGTLWLQY